jgi:hypothetical protein
VGMQNGAATVENTIVLQKDKHLITIEFSNSTPKHLPKGLKTEIEQILLYPFS